MRKIDMKRWLPYAVLAIFVGYVGSAIGWAFRSGSEFDLAGFGRLPVAVNGRVQPLDSAARVALLQIRGSITVPDDEYRQRQFWMRSGGVTATEWLLEVLANPTVADGRRIFRVGDAAVRAIAVRPEESPFASDYYSFETLQRRVKEIGDAVAPAWKAKPADRTATDRAWLQLRDDLVMYERLKNTLQPNSFLQDRAAGKPVDYDFGAQLATYEADLRNAGAAKREGKVEVLDKATEERVLAFIQPYVAVSRTALISLIPPSEPERGRDRWVNAGIALVGSSRTGTFPAPLLFFARMSGAYAHGNADDFNRELGTYQKWLAARGLGEEVRRAGTEWFYNAFQPLVKALAIYVIVLVFGVVSAVKRSMTLYRSAVLLLLFGAALHLTGILFDMMLQGTLPITNVYSAIVFFGGLTVVVGALIEHRYTNTAGIIAAAAAGVGTLGAAHGITPGGFNALIAQMFDVRLAVAVLVTVAARINDERQTKP